MAMKMQTTCDIHEKFAQCGNFLFNLISVLALSGIFLISKFDKFKFMYILSNLKSKRKLTKIPRSLGYQTEFISFLHPIPILVAMNFEMTKFFGTGTACMSW